MSHFPGLYDASLNFIFIERNISNILWSKKFNPLTADIRNLDVFKSDVPEIPAIGIDAMKKLVKKLKFNYTADTFENPSQRVSREIGYRCVFPFHFVLLKTFYSNLEALVFEQEGETIEDTTLPDVDLQDTKIQPVVDELSDIFGRVWFQLWGIDELVNFWYCRTLLLQQNVQHLRKTVNPVQKFRKYQPIEISLFLPSPPIM